MAARQKRQKRISAQVVEDEDYQLRYLTDPGFSDVAAGTQVVVTDSGGKVVGTSALGFNAKQSSFQSGLQPGLSVCIYPFTVTVPGGLPRYGVKGAVDGRSGLSDAPGTVRPWP